MGKIDAQHSALKSGHSAVVRTAVGSDAGAIVDVMRAVVAEGPYTLTEPDEFDWTEGRKQQEIDEHTRQTGYLFLVAEVDGQVVGFLDFTNGHRRRTRHSGSFSIFVAKDWRQVGVGRALIRALLDWAAGNPLIEKVTLAVFSTNERAIALYQSMGFEVEGRCPRDMRTAGEYVDSILMYRFVKGKQPVSSQDSDPPKAGC